MPDLFDSFPPADRPAAAGKPKEKAAADKSAGPAGNSRTTDSYTAKDIEVLEGLEPVRRRPGMYIGGTDEPALHHLAAEILDNAMDEAVAGHASRIEVDLAADGTLTIHDNGRGIPIDPHPKYRDKSALEVILTTLHSGGKFSDTVYKTAGGLHGVGISVVNALSDRLTVEVARERRLWRQTFRRGVADGPLQDAGTVVNRRGTTVSFHPDPQIFGDQGVLSPTRLYRMARSKAYLFRGVEIRWRCAGEKLADDGGVPAEAVLHFPGGLVDFLAGSMAKRSTLVAEPFAGAVDLTTADSRAGRLEWAVTWPADEEGFLKSYCNTIPTPEGGTHEAGLRTALLKGLRAFGDLTGNKRVSQIAADDVTGGACAMLSVFVPDPQFQGQTKEKLVSQDVSRLVENGLRDHFDHWLSGDPETATALLEQILTRAEERLRRRKEKETQRKTATRRLRLPGKLADCSSNVAADTEIFLVEGDSAGGSAKQARDRKTQAVLPLRGKILNVASASSDKARANQELNDLTLALGCGVRERYDNEALRYDRVIIMTDADVDGAHIAALLMTFFFREMPQLVRNGHLYLANPPLYRLTQGGKTAYARDDAHKDALMADFFSGKGKIDISRFKGLGEMPPQQLKTTTMAVDSRSLIRVVLPEDPTETTRIVETLMGRKAERRFSFIQENARFVKDVDI